MTVDFAEMNAMLVAQSNYLETLVKNVNKLTFEDSYFTISQAAKYLKISPSTLRRYLPEIVHFKRDRVILLKKSELDKWVATHSK
jgi:excisionase family DNA binding protein